MSRTALTSDPPDCSAAVMQRLTLPRQLDQLAPLRNAIAQVMAGLERQRVNAMTLAAFEAATNIIRHATVPSGDTAITAIIERTIHQISVELVYAGTPFIPPAQLEPDFSGESSGGFGLYMMAASVDRVSYGAPATGLASIHLASDLPHEPAAA